MLGVVQICHKGFDLVSAGPDFTLDDLQQLELAAKALSTCAFMHAGFLASLKGLDAVTRKLLF